MLCSLELGNHVVGTLSTLLGLALILLALPSLHQHVNPHLGLFGGKTGNEAPVRTLYKSVIPFCTDWAS